MANVAVVDVAKVLGIDEATFKSCSEVENCAILISKIKEYVSIAEVQKDVQAKASAKFESQQVNHEKRFAELEKKVMSADQRLKKKIEEYSELQQKFSTSEKNLAEKANQLTSSSTLEAETNSKLLNCELLLKQAQEDVRNRDEVLDKKQIELDRERDSGKRMFEEKEDAEKRARNATQETEQIRQQVSTLTMREHRLKQEVKMMSEQKAFVDQELAKHMQEARADRIQMSSQLSDLQRKHDEQIGDMDSLNVTKESAKNESKVLSSRVAQLQQKLEDCEKELLVIQKQSKLEIDNKTKLCELYKNMAEGNSSQIEELSGVIEEVHKEHAANQKTQTEALESSEVKMTKASQELKEATQRVNVLEEQLRDVNIQLGRNTSQIVDIGSQDPNALFPTASRASQKLKGGITLTEMYAQLTQAQDARDMADLKATKVEQDLHVILKEIEYKTPALVKQKDDLEHAEGKIVELTGRMQESNLECRQLDEKIRESNRRVAFLDRERQVLEKQNSDMSQQVQQLLVVNEQLRTDRTVPQDSDASMSDDVIGSNLVSVKSVGEMQQQNVQLRAVVRELSEQREAEERSQAEANTLALRAKLDSAANQIESLRSEREKQEEMVKTIVRQRDMFKALYHESYSKAEGTIDVISAQSTHQSPPPQQSKATKATTPKSVGKGKGTPSSSSQDANSQLLRDLQASFNSYRSEQATNNTMVAEESARIRQELDSKQAEKAEVELALERARDHVDQLKASHSGHMQERQHLQNRIHEHQTISSGLERRLKELDQDLVDTKAEVRRLAVDLSNATAEKQLCAESEKRLTLENTSLTQERSNQLTLFVNVQSAISSLKREGEQSRQRLVGQMEEYKNECTTLRKRLDEAEELQKSNVNQIEKQREALREDLSKEQQKHHHTREELVETTCKRTSLEQNIEAVSAQLDEYKKKLNSMLAGNASPEDEKRQLESAIVEIAALKKKASDATARVDQFKAIASAAEAQMSDVHKAQEELQKIVNESRVKHEEELTTAKKAATEASDVLNKTKTQLEKAEKELTELQTQVQSQRVDTEKDLARLRKEGQTSKDALAEAEENGKRFSAEAVESMDKYRKEIILHAADLEALKTARTQRDDLQKEITQAKTDCDSANLELKASVSSWEDQKKILEDGLEKETNTVVELRKQNTNFHTIVNELRALVSAKHDAETSSIAPSSSSASASDSSALDSKTAKDLLEVVRYEKQRAEIAQTHYEEIKLQVLSYEQRCQSLERQVADAQKSLQRERTRNQGRAEHIGEYNELMSKVETLNLLQDSNRLLRDDNTRADNLAAELKAKVKQLESEITPLKEALRKTTKEQRDLTAAQVSMKNDLIRWKTRAIQLRDQYQNIDPDHHRKLQEEKKAYDEFKVTTEAKTKALTTTITELNAKVTELSTSKQLDAIKKQLADATTKFTAKETANVTLRTNMAKIRKLANKYKTEAATLKTETTSLTEKIAQLEASVAAVQTSTDSKSAEIEGSIEKLKATHTAELAKVGIDNQAAVEKAEEALKKMKILAQKYKKGYTALGEKVKQLKAEKEGVGMQAPATKKMDVGAPTFVPSPSMTPASVTTPTPSTTTTPVITPTKTKEQLMRERLIARKPKPAVPTATTPTTPTPTTSTPSTAKPSNKRQREPETSESSNAVVTEAPVVKKAHTDATAEATKSVPQPPITVTVTKSVSQPPVTVNVVTETAPTPTTTTTTQPPVAAVPETTVPTMDMDVSEGQGQGEDIVPDVAASTPVAFDSTTVTTTPATEILAETPPVVAEVIEPTTTEAIAIADEIEPETVPVAMVTTTPPVAVTPAATDSVVPAGTTAVEPTAETSIEPTTTTTTTTTAAATPTPTTEATPPTATTIEPVTRSISRANRPPVLTVTETQDGSGVVANDEEYGVPHTPLLDGNESNSNAFAFGDSIETIPEAEVPTSTTTQPATANIDEEFVETDVDVVPETSVPDDTDVAYDDMDDQVDGGNDEAVGGVEVPEDVEDDEDDNGVEEADTQVFVPNEDGTELDDDGDGNDLDDENLEDDAVEDAAATPTTAPPPAATTTTTSSPQTAVPTTPVVEDKEDQPVRTASSFKAKKITAVEPVAAPVPTPTPTPTPAPTPATTGTAKRKASSVPGGDAKPDGGEAKRSKKAQTPNKDKEKDGEPAATTTAGRGRGGRGRGRGRGGGRGVRGRGGGRFGKNAKKPAAK